LPRAAAVLAAPDGRRTARTGARRRFERYDVDRVGIVGMHDDGEPKVGREPLGDGMPSLAVVVAAQHADAGPFGPAAVGLHVEPARRVGVAGDLVDPLAELGVRIGHEAGPDALV